MTRANSEGRQCPTRTDGADTLIAHWITEGTCAERRARNYHKCFGCAFGDAHGAPERVIVPAPVAEALPEPGVVPAAAQAV